LGRRGYQKIAKRSKAGEEGSPVEVETNKEEMDNEKCWGDDMGPKNKNLRIFYNNVNGLNINEFMKTKYQGHQNSDTKQIMKGMRSTQKVTGILSILRSWDANILCLAETQSAWENYKVKDEVEKEMRKNDRYAGMIGSSSSTLGGDYYKPGGTLTVYNGNWSNRITRGVDPHKLGRWSFITLKGRNSSFLTIVTDYRVCKTRGIGMTTTYMQQETLLKKRN